MRYSPLLYLLSAAVVGAAYQWVAAAFWGYYAAITPMQGVLLNVLGSADEATVRSIVTYAHDLVLNIAIALPFAAVFRWVPALRTWFHVTLAVGVHFLLSYGSISLVSWAGLLVIPRFWAGIAFTLLSLPAAYFLLNLVGTVRSAPETAQEAA